MGREGHETTVVCSSIALLQERFRQLERVKEMREERELLRLFSEPNNTNNNNNVNKQFDNPGTATNVYEPSRLFFHPDLIFPQRSTSSQKVSLSLWPSTFRSGFDGSDDDQYYYSCSSVKTTPMFMKLWPFEEAPSNESQDYSDGFIYETDVDTSLHL